MATAPQMGWYERNGAQLRFKTSGAAGAPIVFIHGLTCSMEHWRFQVKHFSARHRVIACDLRGHGQSSVGNGPICMESFGADVAGLLRHLDLNDATIVGHSMGSRVVIETFRHESARIKNIVLVDGSRRTTGGSADEREARIHNAVRKQGYKAYHLAQFGPMFTADSDPSLRDTTISECAATPEAVGVASSVSSHRWDAGRIDAVLSGVSAPILVIQSTKPDPNTLRAPLHVGEVTDYMHYVRDTAVKAPSVQFETIPGIGHFTMLERPDDVNRHIATFIG
jgi:pimeloyl-ACP methyl ester carboxylesterase